MTQGDRKIISGFGSEIIPAGWVTRSLASLEFPTLAGAWRLWEPSAGAVLHCQGGVSFFTGARENGIMQGIYQSQSDARRKVCAELGKMGA